MTKVALLVPRTEILEQSEKIIKNYKLDFIYKKVIQTDRANLEGIIAEEMDAEIIIARGVQALKIKNIVKIPVVEIRLTGQEMGSLIIKAKSLVNKKIPKIGIVGYANMFCDMSSFDELFNVNLYLSLIKDSDDFSEYLERVKLNHVDIIIGGDIACNFARENNIPSVFIMSGNESLDEGFRIAEKIAFGIELEKKNTAELKALLDFSFNGIIKIDNIGNILRVNHLAEKILKKSELEIIGKKIISLMPQITDEMLSKVLNYGEEVFSIYFNINSTDIILNIAPIILNNNVDSAIISFHEEKKVIEMEAEVRRENNKKAFSTKHNFEMLSSIIVQGKEIIANGKIYAKYNKPILILGKDCFENEIIAQSIHNESQNKDLPFISFNCKTLNDLDFENIIFRKPASSNVDLFSIPKKGTLYLDNVSSLSLKSQSLLFEYLKSKIDVFKFSHYKYFNDYRIITSSSNSLIELFEEKTFDKNLYYVLNTLPLYIKHIQNRKKDLMNWLKYFIESLEKEHKRYIVFTFDALNMLEHLDWNGGFSEIYFFCERIIMLSPRRKVNEINIKILMELGMIPNEYVLSYQKQMNSENILSEQEIKLRAALKKFDGNRQLTAKELNISLTTLWRYMKKYGIYNEKTGKINYLTISNN